jgi:ubiquinone/menaquinone biosynthesis C-methylase UbiE
MGRVEIMEYGDCGYHKDGTRWLDIGPGWHKEYRIPGFETLDVEERGNVDHVADAEQRLPFDDNTFDLIHASHVLEHIVWIKTQDVMNEWVRVLKPGGTIEIWLPNAEGIFKAWMQAEKGNPKLFKAERGKLWNKRGNNPWAMANGLLLSAKGIEFMPWGIHKAIFTEKALREIMTKAGITSIKRMKAKDMRETKPGILKKKNWMRRQMWMNLGLKGKKQ